MKIFINKIFKQSKYRKLAVAILVMIITANIALFPNIVAAAEIGTGVGAAIGGTIGTFTPFPIVGTIGGAFIGGIIGNALTGGSGQGGMFSAAIIWVITNALYVILV